MRWRGVLYGVALPQSSTHEIGIKLKSALAGRQTPIRRTISPKDYAESMPLTGQGYTFKCRQRKSLYLCHSKTSARQTATKFISKRRFGSVDSQCDRTKAFVHQCLIRRAPLLSIEQQREIDDPISRASEIFATLSTTWNRRRERDMAQHLCCRGARAPER